MWGFNDKVVLISGASSGIGEATALLLADRGYKLVLGARGSDRLEALVARIVDLGGEVAVAHADVRRRDDLSDLVTLARDRFGKLDVFISNTGGMPISPKDELRIEEWAETIDIHLRGVLYGIGAALPVFRSQGFGHFICTASIAGHIAGPNQSVDAGTKFAVRAISEDLRQETGEVLHVTIIAPGYIRTNFAETMRHPKVIAELDSCLDPFAVPPAAIARAIAFAVEQPTDVDVNSRWTGTMATC